MFWYNSITCFFILKMAKIKSNCWVFSIGIYDDDPEIITLDRGEFGKF